MYREYFGLKENPFSIAPDPHYFYLSEGHREALAHLVYGIESDGGFILLTGEVGTGKTMVCRCLLEQMPDNSDIAFILNPKLTVPELLATMCDEFGIAYPEGTVSNKVFIDGIYSYLLETNARGRRAILIVEEAQNLSVEVLEQVRLLTNLETNERKLLQLIMLGQTELRDMLARPELRQLSQRITARYHMGPLAKKEISKYVRHRLKVAGMTRGTLFTEKAMGLLCRVSGGIPRLINVICDRALTGAYVEDKDKVDKKILLRAAREVSGENLWWRPLFRTHWKTGFMYAAILVILGVGAFYVSSKNTISAPTASPAVSSSPAKAAPATAAPVPKPFSLEIPPTLTGAQAGHVVRQALFGMWEISYDAGDSRSVCRQASSQGIRCTEERGTLSSLRRFNRPALLTLRNGKGGGEYEVLVTALKGETADVRVGNDSGEVHLNELLPRWSGQYLILWRPPSGYEADVAKGSSGPLVAWIDRQLALLEGRTVRPGREPVYDKEMERQVTKFQTTVGLTADGVAGAKTILCLMDAAGAGGPSLGARRTTR
ncbi:MAG TPA: AAA family ATPase [Syntrophorhabdaceae bacterium]|jgi:general secretion pathway protein A